MSEGEGIFWAGFFYFAVQLVGYIICSVQNRFTNKHIQRLDKIEAILAEIGIKL